MAERTITLRLELEGRQVEARLRATGEEARRLRQALDEAGEQGTEALDRIEQELQQGTIRSLRQAHQAMQLLDAAFEEATDDATRARIVSLSAQVHQLRGSMLQAAGATSGSFNPATIQLVRLIQDAQYGFLGMANNLQELIFQLVQGARAGGGLRQVLAGLAGGLMGPAGLVAGLSLLIGFGPQILDFFLKWAGGAEEAAEQTKKLREEAARAAASELRNLFGDLSVEQLERLRKEQERIVAARQRAVDLQQQELDRLQATIDRLTTVARPTGLTEQELEALREAQAQRARLLAFQTRSNAALAEAQGTLQQINDELAQATRAEAQRKLLLEAAGKAGIQLKEDLKEQEKVARGAAKEAEREAAARERAAAKAAEALAAARERESLEAERRALEDEVLDDDLDIGRTLFVLSDQVRALMEQGVTARDVLSGLADEVGRVDEALKAANEELLRMQEEGADTAEVETLIARLARTRQELIALQRIGEVTASALGQAFEAAAVGIGEALGGLEGALSQVGTNLQLIVADLASSIARIFLAMAAAAAVALDFGRAARLTAAAAGLFVLSGVIRAQAQRGRESEAGPGANPAVVSNRTRSGFQAGGFVPGTGRGDLVPALLEPGEFVVRRRVAQALGPALRQLGTNSPAAITASIDERSLERLSERVRQTIDLRVAAGVLPSGDLRVSVEEARRKARRIGVA
ncbi:MAG: hypothetical protein KatS3mg051_1584 [Anaerolineae bacterium]|nr:MAG: hypothetical protein KatS3mg051_1584 [Anaerolineae bacterium]